MSVTKTEPKIVYQETDGDCSVEFDPGHIESFVMVDSAGNRSDRMNVLEMRSFLQLLRFLEGEGTI